MKYSAILRYVEHSLIPQLGELEKWKQENFKMVTDRIEKLASGCYEIPPSEEDDDSSNAVAKPILDYFDKVSRDVENVTRIFIHRNGYEEKILKKVEENID